MSGFEARGRWVRGACRQPVWSWARPLVLPLVLALGVVGCDDSGDSGRVDAAADAAIARPDAARADGGGGRAGQPGDAGGSSGAGPDSAVVDNDAGVDAAVLPDTAPPVEGTDAGPDTATEDDGAVPGVDATVEPTPDASVDTAPPPPPPPTALVRVVHGSPDAPAVDVYAKGGATPLFTNLAYGQVAPYIRVPVGSYGFDLRPAGGDPGQAPLYSSPDAVIAPTAEQRITVLAAGLAASTDPSNQLRLLAFTNGFAPTSGASARLRIVHAGPDAPTVGVDVGNDGSVDIADIARFSETGADGVSLPAGQSLRVALVASGGRRFVFTLPALAANSTAYLIADGLLSRLPRETTGLSLWLLGDGLTVVRQDPTLFLLHASPETIGIDVFSNAREWVDDLRYGQISQPITVSPGSYDVAVFGHTFGPTRPSTSPLATGSVSNLLAGERYLVLATGLLAPSGSQKGFQLLTVKEQFGLASNTPELRVIHAAPDAPSVDVGTIANNAPMPTLTPINELRSLRFGTSSAEAGVGLSPGVARLGVAPESSTTPVAEFYTILTPGQRVFAVASGLLKPSATNPFAFELLLVDTAPTANSTSWTVSRSANTLPPN